MFKKKDGQGYGNLDTQDVSANSVVHDDETYVGAPIDKPIDEHETYIGKETKSRTDMNKITSTKIGDEIRYMSNGVEGTGVVAKMSNSYITIFKADGQLYDVHINDTFFVKDILLNKTWDDMTPPEKFELLQKVHAPTPRYVVKRWAELPRELQEAMKEHMSEEDKEKKRFADTEEKERKKLGLGSAKDVDTSLLDKTVRGKKFGWNQMDTGVRAEYNIGSTKDWDSLTDEQRTNLKNQGVHHGKKTRTEGIPITPDKPPKGTHFGDVGKSDVEQGGYGNVAGTPYAPIATGTPIDADDDYEGQSHVDFSEQFKHEDKKPKTDADKKEAKKVGEFVYTESTKYRTKGIPETQAPTWGTRQFIMKESDIEEQIKKHTEWHNDVITKRASTNRIVGTPEWISVDQYTVKCNMCGQEFTKKKQ